MFTVVRPSLGVLKFVMPSDPESSFVICFGSTVLALSDSKLIGERLKQEVNNDPIGNPSLNEALNYTHQMAATDKHGNKAKMACLPAA